ncbi:MAG: M10 family metallopeptidase, partial [Gammaproteobacteria bacterium]|nr:M10 family metallopeptidase [Gammaproteobacteria bacterium]
MPDHHETKVGQAGHTQPQGSLFGPESPGAAGRSFVGLSEPEDHVVHGQSDAAHQEFGETRDLAKSDEKVEPLAPSDWAPDRLTNGLVEKASPMYPAALTASATDASSGRSIEPPPEGTGVLASYEHHTRVKDNWKWNSTVLKYTILESAPDYYDESFVITSPTTGIRTTVPMSTFDALNSEQVAAVKDILLYIQTFTGLQFQEVNDPNEADLTFGMLGWGGANPMQNAVAFGSNGPLTDPPPRLTGDVWFNKEVPRNLAPLQDSRGYLTFLHEIGHALGLAHPFETSPPLPPAEDNYRYTVMSYTEFFPVGTSPAQFVPSEYMIYDVAALRSYYGEKMVGEGGTVIVPTPRDAANPRNEFLTLIIDDEGRDVIDITIFSSAPNVVDLRQGAFSSVGATWRTASSQQLEDLIQNPLANVAIAFGTIIEDVKGSDNDDLLIGNAEDNFLIGSDGDDLIYGDGVIFDGQPGYGSPVSYASGSDTLEGGLGDDLLFGGEGEDKLYGGADNDVLVGGIDFRTSDQDADYLDGGPGC